MLDLTELKVAKHNGTWIIQCAVFCCLLMREEKLKDYQYSYSMYKSLGSERRIKRAKATEEKEEQLKMSLFFSTCPFFG